MAADESTPKQPQTESVERQVSYLLGYLQGPIKHVQDWVSGGQLQSTIENLQEHAERAQEGVGRRLRAWGEVRQGLEIHVRKQLEAYRKGQEELAQDAEDTAVEESTAAEPAPGPRASNEPKRPPQARTSKARPAAKKAGTKPSTGRKR